MCLNTSEACSPTIIQESHPHEASTYETYTFLQGKIISSRFGKLLLPSWVRVRVRVRVRGLGSGSGSGSGSGLGLCGVSQIQFTERSEKPPSLSSLCPETIVSKPSKTIMVTMILSFSQCLLISGWSITFYEWMRSCLREWIKLYSCHSSSIEA